MIFRDETPFLSNKTRKFVFPVSVPPITNAMPFGPLARNDFSNFQNKIKSSARLRNVPPPGVTAFNIIIHLLLLFKTNKNDKTSVGATPGQKELEYLIKTIVLHK